MRLERTAYLLRRCGVKAQANEGKKQLADKVVDIMPELSVLEPMEILRHFCKHFVSSPPSENEKQQIEQSSVRVLFYETRNWRTLRYEVLKARGRRCECCGRTPKDGIALHVDHIKPRSLYPELELVADNLQVLCEDCNVGKSNRDEIDWRSACTSWKATMNLSHPYHRNNNRKERIKYGSPWK